MLGNVSLHSVSAIKPQGTTTDHCELSGIHFPLTNYIINSLPYKLHLVC